MEVSKLPLDRRWIEKELKPYLYYAFSHALHYDVDIGPQIEHAIEFCMYKADFPRDGDDLMFERACIAVDRRDLDYDPELKMVTEDLECLAKFLIRRAQLKGPYELLGRTNIGGSAWIEYQLQRLEREPLAEENKKHLLITALVTAPKPAPAEEQIDTRLFHAQPGQYASSAFPGVLTVADDQYFRYQNLLSQRRQRQDHPIDPNWPQQLQNAAAIPHTQEHPSLQIPGRGWTYGQPPVYGLPPHQVQAPTYVQHLGQRDAAYGDQAFSTGFPALNRASAGSGMQQAAHAPYVPHTSWDATNHSLIPPALHPQDTPMMTAWQQHRRPLPILHKPVVGSPLNSPMHRGPVHNDDAAMAQSNLHSSANIPVSDIAHLRGQDWNDAAEQRVREFSLLTPREKAERLLQLRRMQPSSAEGKQDMKPQSFSVQGLNMAGWEGHQHIPQPGSQPQAQSGVQPTQQPEVNMNGAQNGFLNHPGYSNVKSSFPDTLYRWTGGAQ
ncbi:hypothetical protein EK21DRAFT_86851 [Setomelanomma holmii]|uniref:Uncharacterized protein n=1 Tax=Setomelanomma holmii TaxID=210430 RepID=A0A9P4HGY6_9PLEO|nr:hypothetical protein EK21DRAFT_86851 [Setomelanomma holmii]